MFKSKELARQDQCLVQDENFQDSFDSFGWTLGFYQITLDNIGSLMNLLSKINVEKLGGKKEIR